MIQITLKQMLEELVECILHNKELNTYYWRRLNYITEEPEYIEIIEVDLMRGRFITIDDDFCEYEWVLNSNDIFRKE